MTGFVSFEFSHFPVSASVLKFVLWTECQAHAVPVQSTGYIISVVIVIII